MRSIEQEQSRKERIVKLSEKFHPFDPDYTTQKRLFKPFYTFKQSTSQVSLYFEEAGEKLPFQIKTEILSGQRHLCVGGRSRSFNLGNAGIFYQINTLRLQVFSEKDSVELKPSNIPLEFGDILLFTINMHSLLIHRPSDLQKLSQIRAKFVLADHDPQKAIYSVV